MRFRLLAILAVLLSVAAARAQDTRNVTEPVYPQICKILYAELTPHNGALPEEPIERHYRDNDRILKAMNNCPAGQSVVLHASKTGKTVFLISPLKLRAGITLVVDASAAIWGSRDPRNYDVAPGSCGVVGPAGESNVRGSGCLPLILVEDAPHSGIMGEGVIDGRGGAKLLIGNNKEGETWWELAHRAKVEDANQAVSRILIVRRSPDFKLYRITLRNSPNCHVTTENEDGFTAWGVHIDTPKWARNTDGIDPQSGSTNISIVNSYIRAGDDNISPKANSAGVTHMTVRNTHFYNGHGFGIGSQTQGGISAIRVDGLTIDGADNGIRIKSDRSRGGLVNDVQFENVCMRGVGKPIVLDPFYTTFEGTRIPLYRNILLRNVHSLSAGPLTIAGLDSAHRLEATFENVVIDGLKPAEITAHHAVLTIRHGNLSPDGDDVKTTGSDGGGTPYNCDGKFIPFEQNTVSPVSEEVIPPADNTFYVAADGTGDYYSVQTALQHVPSTGGLVLVAPGTYRERLFVRQSHVTLKSANPDPRKTVIISDTTRGPQQGIATVSVRGDDFLAENITFANDFKGANAEQQALFLGGDRNVLRNVHLLGGQHTVYLAARNCSQASLNPCEPTRTYIARSFIAGNMEVLIGDGELYCEDCELHSTEHAAVNGASGFLASQGKHYSAQQSIFVFKNARMTAQPGVTNVYLGNPWRDLSTVIYLYPVLGSHIGEAGFHERNPSGKARMETATFRIFAPTGPGAPTQTRQLTPQEASHYGVHEVLGGKDFWDPLSVR